MVSARCWSVRKKIRFGLRIELESSAYVRNEREEKQTSIATRQENAPWELSTAEKEAKRQHTIAQWRTDVYARRMSEKQKTGVRKAGRWVGAIRAEVALFFGILTAAIFLWAGSALIEIIGNPIALIVVFLWLFAVILWSAVSVVRHADCLAVKWGEPYGTLVLTLSAISVEVVMISAAMLHGQNNPALGRDAIFAVVMIALSGFVGLVLLLGGLRHGEQYYNLEGVNSYLNVIMTLAVLGLVVPNFTTTTGEIGRASCRE